MKIVEHDLLKEFDSITQKDDAALDFLKRRVIGAVFVIMMFLGLILGRLWYLQIHHGTEYEKRAESNRVRTLRVAAPRGHIFDRHGHPIVTNRPSFNVVLVREDSHDLDDILKRLAAVLGVDVSVFWKRIREHGNQPLYVPIRLQEDIDWQSLAYLENHNHEFSGIRIEVLPVRQYEHNDLAANTIGYLGVISKKELEDSHSGHYRGDDIVGKTGLEKLHEVNLRGEKGRRYSEVNAKGFEQALIKKEDPLPGNDLVLNLDIDLQKTAEVAMEVEGRSGAVVVMEVNSGRLLALATTPQVHLQDFIGGISQKNWRRVADNPKKPLMHKAIQGAYPPGSVFKMMTALAGLAKGVINKDTIYYCSGSHFFGDRTYRCWKKSGHGAVNLRQAIAESCDVYFYQVGLRVGVDAIAEVANRYGLGGQTGIELENENRGLVPTKKWKKKKYRTRWQDGETLSVAIGQGFNLVTPLQICVMTAALANGGRLYRPLLVDTVTDPDGKIVTQFAPEIIGNPGSPLRHLKLIRDGMIDVVQGAAGTARGVRVMGVTVAGKTGTAQVVKLSKHRHLSEEEIPYNERDHAWFTCYVPAEKPEIAVTVLVEHGMHGGSGAGPIARTVIERYFSQRSVKNNADKSAAIAQRHEHE